MHISSFLTSFLGFDKWLKIMFNILRSEMEKIHGNELSTIVSKIGVIIINQGITFRASNKIKTIVRVTILNHYSTPDSSRDLRDKRKKIQRTECKTDQKNREINLVSE